MRSMLLLATLITGLHSAGHSAALAEEPLAIGSRLELFVDDFLIDQLAPTLQQILHRPEPGDVVLVTDQPWEGNTCAYYTIFHDGDLYRMYYRGSHGDVKTQKSLHPEVTCYAESHDGMHWTKPSLGIVEWEGSTDNNIILQGLGSHCFVAFRDDNPAAPPEARYKGISRGRPFGSKGLYVFQSPDAIHWTLIRDEPVITNGAFDSQNLAFWDAGSQQYVDYHRTFTDGVRAIMMCTSPDFLEWSEPVLLQYPEGTPKQHLYTNAIAPYYRAPHIRLGFPTRYRPADSQVEPILMSSRDGVNFVRWNDALIPPDAPEERDGNRSNYMGYGLVPHAEDPARQLLYASEAYYEGPDSRLRYFSIRTDGFVSIHAAEEPGDLITRPFTFTGDRLCLNFITGEEGLLQVELQTADGAAVPGFELGETVSLTGDHLSAEVKWKSCSSVSSLVGQVVRLRIRLQQADLYSLQFRPAE